MCSGMSSHVVVERPAHVHEVAIVAPHLRVYIQLEEEAGLDGDAILRQPRGQMADGRLRMKL